MQAQSIIEGQPVNNKPSLIKMVWSPLIQMEKIKINPRTLIAFLIVTLLYTIGTATMALHFDLSSIIGEVPNAEGNETLFRGILIGSAALSGVTTPIFNILISSVIFYVIAKLINAPVTFRQLFSMNTYIMVIGVIGMLLNSALIYILNLESIQSVTSLGILLGDKTFDKIEFFSIWQTILTGVGLYKIAEFPKMICWIITILMFGLIIFSGFLLPEANIVG